MAVHLGTTCWLPSLLEPRLIAGGGGVLSSSHRCSSAPALQQPWKSAHNACLSPPGTLCWSPRCCAKSGTHWSLHCRGQSSNVFDDVFSKFCCFFIIVVSALAHHAACTEDHCAGPSRT